MAGAYSVSCASSLYLCSVKQLKWKFSSGFGQEKTVKSFRLRAYVRDLQNFHTVLKYSWSQRPQTYLSPLDFALPLIFESFLNSGGTKAERNIKGTNSTCRALWTRWSSCECGPCWLCWKCYSGIVKWEHCYETAWEEHSVTLWRAETAL